jgi:hypothetical protein
MTEKYYNNLKKITKRICNGDSRGEDLMHDVIINLQKNERYNSLDDKTKVFFFTKTIKTQYTSNNSKFQRDYRRYEFDELPVIDEVRQDETPYEERPTISWILETLSNEVKDNPDFWYDEGIFKLFLEEKQLERLHRRTQIPKYSLRETLKNVKEILRNKWIIYEKQNYNTGKGKM